MEIENRWGKLPRVARTIPFGYKLDEEDPSVLVPIPFELEALEEAKKHVKRFSYRNVAEWLTELTGRSITYVGLKKRIESDRTKRYKVGAAKSWAVRAKEAEEKARSLEEKLLGTPTTE